MKLAQTAMASTKSSPLRPSKSSRIFLRSVTVLLSQAFFGRGNAFPVVKSHVPTKSKFPLEVFVRMSSLSHLTLVLRQKSLCGQHTSMRCRWLDTYPHLFLELLIRLSIAYNLADFLHHFPDDDIALWSFIRTKNPNHLYSTIIDCIFSRAPEGQSFLVRCPTCIQRSVVVNLGS